MHHESTPRLASLKGPLEVETHAGSEEYEIHFLRIDDSNYAAVILIKWFNHVWFNYSCVNNYCHVEVTWGSMPSGRE